MEGCRSVSLPLQLLPRRAESTSSLSLSGDPTENLGRRLVTNGLRGHVTNGLRGHVGGLSETTQVVESSMWSVSSETEDNNEDGTLPSGAGGARVFDESPNTASAATEGEESRHI